MRVQTEEWRRFIPGVRMYKGKKTLFYNGEILVDRDATEFFLYDEEERQSWEVIIVLPGVEVIPENTFRWCFNVEKVIMADTVKRIEEYALFNCKSLSQVRLSTRLEYIGRIVFGYCASLTSIFIPPSCREIDDLAFDNCEKLIILSVPQHTHLGMAVTSRTAILKASPFSDRFLDYSYDNSFDEVNRWLKNINQAEEFALHRACSSFNPLQDIVYDIVKRQGISLFKKPNSIRIKPSQYLKENPYTELEERKIINRYILDMMGEILI